MWLRNFDLACAASQSNNGSYYLPSAEGAVAGEDGYNYVRDSYGGWQQARISNYQFMPCSINCDGYPTKSTNNHGFCFGTGTTPASYDDFWLENPIESGFSFARQTKNPVYDTTSKKFIFTLFADYLNNTVNDIVISELGYCGRFGFDGQSARSYMVLREVLDAPITVHAGEYIRVTLSYEVGAYPNKPTVTAATV